MSLSSYCHVCMHRCHTMGEGDGGSKTCPQFSAFLWAECFAILVSVALKILLWKCKAWVCLIVSDLSWQLS